jgi:hypothetical protein
VRWAALFADLEAQLEAAEEAELAGEVADRQRLEVARLELVDRFRAALDAELTIGLRSGEVIHGSATRVGPDWLLLTSAGRPDALVPVGAVSWVRGLPPYVRVPATIGAVEARLDLAFVLRGLARDRAFVHLALLDGSTVSGTIDRVGRDFLDLAEHAPEDARRADAVSAVRTVGFDAVVVVRPV